MSHRIATVVSTMCFLAVLVVCTPILGALARVTTHHKVAPGREAL